MTVTTTTHLNFRGQARAALQLYASIFGGEVTAFSYATPTSTPTAPYPISSCGAASRRRTA